MACADTDFLNKGWHQADAQAWYACKMVERQEKENLWRNAVALISQATAFYIADKQYSIAKEYSQRAEDIHQEQLKRLKSDIAMWEDYAKSCLVKTIQEDCAVPLAVPRYSEMQARSEAIVRMQFSKARQQAAECADIYCIGASCGQQTQLKIAEAIAMATVAARSRVLEETRVDMKNQAARQNRLNSIAAVRGIYNDSRSGLDALAKVFAQTGSQAAAAAGGSLAAGATGLGRMFGGSNSEAVPTFRQQQPQAPMYTMPVNTSADTSLGAAIPPVAPPNQSPASVYEIKGDTVYENDGTSSNTVTPGINGNTGQNDPTWDIFDWSPLNSRQAQP